MFAGLVVQLRPLASVTRHSPTQLTSVRCCHLLALGATSIQLSTLTVIFLWRLLQYVVFPYPSFRFRKVERLHIVDDANLDVLK